MKNFFEVTEIKEKSSFDDKNITQDNLTTEIKVGDYVQYYLKSTTIESSHQPFIYKVIEISRYGSDIFNLIISNGVSTYDVKKSDITLLDEETLKKLVEQEIKKLNYLFKNNSNVKNIILKNWKDFNSTPFLQSTN